MLLYELLMGLSYSLYGLSGLEEITEPVTDSRNAVRGSLFICIRGSKRNGHRYVGDAIVRGAVACVCEDYVSGAPCVLTPDTRLAAARIWYNFHAKPGRSMRLYAVTGTNGKTSTAEFLCSILEAAGKRCAKFGTLGCYFDGQQASFGEAEVSDIPAAMTTPDPKYLYAQLARVEGLGADCAVMEISSHSILQKKVEPLTFHGGIFTNLSPEHLDTHGDMETYFSVKKSLFDKCKITVTNGDDAYGKRIPGVKCTSGMAKNVECTPYKTSYTLRHKGNTLSISTQVAGAFTVQNTMLAAVLALECGIKPEFIEKGIAEVHEISGRMEQIVSRDECGFDVYVDYAHTPAALEAALKSLSGGKRLTVVFGCGGDRDREKRPLMGSAAFENSDRAVVTSDNARTEDKIAIINDILEGIPGRAAWAVIPDRAEAIRYAVETAVPGEIVLLAGKGHENYETDSSGKRPFCEKDIVLETVRVKFGKSIK